MKDYTVVFTPEAEEQLAELYRYVAEKASADTALHHTTAIVDYCEKLRNFPHRGKRRDDIRPGLRIVNYKKNAVVAFSVDDVATTVIVAGIFYGGRDYATLLEPPAEP